MSVVMCSFSVTIVRAADRIYHEAFRNVSLALGSLPEKAKFTPRLMKSQNGNNQEIPFYINQPFHESGSEDDRLEMYLVLSGQLIRVFEYEFEGKQNFVLHRNVNRGETQYNRPCDVIEIVFHHADEQRAAVCVAAVRKHFKCWDDPQLPEGLGEDVKNYYASRESSLVRLESKLGELTSEIARYAIQNEQAYQKKREELESHHRERLSEVEAERQKLLEEHETRRKELDERAEKINDRENVHERRRLYDEIKKQIQSKSTNPKLTDHTQGLRGNVWKLCAILGAFLLTVFGICFYFNIFEDKLNGVAIGSQIASGAGLVGLVTFLIRWQNQWFSAHSEEEFRLKRMELDIERASWLVELSLEWFTETKAPIPQELVNKLATSLFTDGASVPMDISPLEALRTGLLGKNWRVLLEPTKFEAESEREKK